jgi:hypothetical protein
MRQFIGLTTLLSVDLPHCDDLIHAYAEAIEQGQSGVPSFTQSLCMALVKV